MGYRNDCFLCFVSRFLEERFRLRILLNRFVLAFALNILLLLASRSSASAQIDSEAFNNLLLFLLCRFGLSLNPKTLQFLLVQKLVNPTVSVSGCAELYGLVWYITFVEGAHPFLIFRLFCSFCLCEFES